MFLLRFSNIVLKRATMAPEQVFLEVGKCNNIGVYFWGLKCVFDRCYVNLKELTPKFDNWSLL